MIYVIITAAGNSTRMGGKKKEYLPLGNGTVLSENAKKFLLAAEVKKMAVTYSGELEKVKAAFFADAEMEALLKKTELVFIKGGESRQASIYNALESLAAENFVTKDDDHAAKNIVLIHDGARPFVSIEVIQSVIEATKKFGAAVPAIPCVDTLKQIDVADQTRFIASHLERAKLAAVQTPQGFDFSKLLDANRKALSTNKTYTDDSEIWNDFYGRVAIVDGETANKKITYKEDLPKANVPNIKIGLGYDLHRLVENRPLIIGGVTIPFEKGEDGHSDGDALFHAITDAVLGASGLGDIGSFFPPTDEKWRGADSAMLLQTAWRKVTDAGWKLVNLDCVVKLEKPKFLPYREQVCNSIARTLNVSSDCVFVKAKTGEKLGSVGNCLAIEVWATCLLARK